MIYIVEKIEPNTELVNEANKILSKKFNINDRKVMIDETNACLDKLMEHKNKSYVNYNFNQNEYIFESIPIYTLYNKEIEDVITKLQDRLIKLYQTYDKKNVEF